MPSHEEDALLKRRLSELAKRSDQMGSACFSEFLTPPQAQWAQAAAREAGVQLTLSGGYEDAERQMARFEPVDAWETPFPISALMLRWPHQSAPSHRDLLGSVMGLGIRRGMVGDIVVEAQRAYLFAETAMCQHIASVLSSAGRIHLQVDLLDELPTPEPPQGKEVRDTVATPRLDAVVAGGFSLSRAKAAALITAGHVKLRHIPCERSDAHVGENDVISVRGHGRLKVCEIGQPTKKGRYPLKMLRFGERK
ncbi:MAG: RNA-binding protein [Clostridiales bacterium]|nr:RNA-binding protein [Clostridiales bacterium]